MANTYTLEVVTPERIMLSGEVVQTIAPGSEGDLGVLANHIPLMTSLRPGEVRAMFADGRTTSHIVIGGGFMQVGETKTTILADSADRVDEINITQAEADLDEARRMLAEVAVGTPQAREALRASAYAEAKIRAVRG